jgi:hypothetical protein
MAPISTRTHAVGDYAGGALMILAARLPFVRDRRAAALLRVAGAGTLVASATTDYELGLWRRLPVPLHLKLDAGSGALMAGSALLLRRGGARAGSWLPPALIGAGEIAAAALTERAPRGASTAAPAVRAGGGPLPGAATGVSGEGMAAREPGAPVAPPPVETPGPSVTPPVEPRSETERTEQADAALPDAGVVAAGDALVAQQEAAAAAEAAAIGGPAGPSTGDPAMDPVYEAGGGEEEGYEAAEDALIENATHGEGHGDPARDALTPELEADQATAVYGEADELPSTELDESAPGGRDR